MKVARIGKKTEAERWKFSSEVAAIYLCCCHKFMAQLWLVRGLCRFVGNGKFEVASTRNMLKVEMLRMSKWVC